MGYFSFFKNGLFSVKKQKQPTQYYSRNNGNSRLLFVEGFDGEKSLGDIGPIKDYFLKYPELRARGYQFYVDNAVVQIIINRMTMWVVGCGLKLESEPDQTVLNSEGIDIKPQEFSKLIEARFAIYKESFHSSFGGMKNLSQLETACYRNAKTGGDVLVVLRYVNKVLKTELIDGAHVMSPMYGTDWNPQDLADGNRIVNGVEMDGSGTHIAYWVRDAKLKYNRILAINKSTGLKVAYLVGGLEYRLDDSRCVPALTGLFSTLAKMDRYSESTLATAEETSKGAYQINHDLNGTGENPFLKQVVSARDGLDNDGTIPVDIQGNELANKIAITTEKQIFNLPQGAKITPIEKSTAELYFKDFYSTFFDLVCAAMGIPPNVAMGKYDTSFSSARAAIKDWEHTLIVERYNFSLSFLQPIYEFWLHIEILQGKIQAPGYLIADKKDNYSVLSSYRKSRWVGDNVPHIDPLKEVMAERAKLGDTANSIPLTTVESATSVLNGGNSTANIKQYSDELKESKTLGVQPPIIPVVAPVKKD